MGSGMQLLYAWQKREPISSLNDGRAALEMIMAVYESHIQGGRVSIPLQRREHPLAHWSAGSKP